MGENGIVQYAFSNSAPQAQRHLSSLEDYLDPLTLNCLGGLVPEHSAIRCLELGPGRGSIARWMAGRFYPGGRVVAVDRDLSQVPPAQGLELVCADLQHGLPVTGQFDLIHARMVLLHLPNRIALLHALAGALAPSGWLVIGEFRSAAPPKFVASPEVNDADLFNSVVAETLALLSDRYGLDQMWGDRVADAVAQTGLNVNVANHDGTWVGGGPGCGLFSACARQKHSELVSAGLDEADLQRFYTLMDDPRFRCQAWQFVCVSGQKPGPYGRDEQ